MKLRNILILGFAVFVSACATLRNEAPADPAIQGAWVPVSAELAGKKFDFVKDFKLDVKSDRFVTQGGTQRDVGRLVFFDGNPRGVDVIGEDGTSKGQRLPAIYRFNADELEICYDLSGKERPNEFLSKPDTRLFRITYRRGK